MMFKGQPVEDLDPDQLDEAEAEAIKGIGAAQTHYALMTAFYEEIARARTKFEAHSLN